MFFFALGARWGSVGDRCEEGLVGTTEWTALLRMVDGWGVGDEGALVKTNSSMFFTPVCLIFFLDKV